MVAVKNDIVALVVVGQNGDGMIFQLTDEDERSPLQTISLCFDLQKRDAAFDIDQFIIIVEMPLDRA